MVSTCSNILFIVVIFALFAEATALTADRKAAEKRREVEAEDEHAEETAEVHEEPGESQEVETIGTRPRRSGLTGILSRKERAVIGKHWKTKSGKKEKKKSGKNRYEKKKIPWYKTNQMNIYKKPATKKPERKKPAKPAARPAKKKPARPRARPATKKPTTARPTTKKPTTPRPTTKKPTSTPRPTTKKPTTTRRPTTKKPTTRRPMTKKPTTTSRPTIKKPEKPTDDIVQLICLFEEWKSMCGWNNVKSDRLRWKWQRARSSPWGSWGKVDHTTGSSRGSYAYLETVYDPKGSKGSLTSPLLTAGPPTGRCLTFFYNMHQTNGFFKVIMKYNDGSHQTVFLREGDQGNGWLKATVSLVSKKPYWIVFEHTRGSIGQETGLAIDDVVVTIKQCPSHLNDCGTNRYGGISKRDSGPPLEASSEENRTGRQKRILGGKPSRKGEFPWIVHLRVFSAGFSTGRFNQCGGSIIEADWIITAAHCFEKHGRRITDPNKIRIYIGEHNTHSGELEESQFVLIPEKVIHHPDRKGVMNDLTLLKLKYKLTFTENVNKVCMPDRPIPVGTSCVAAGWGVDESDETSKKLLHLDKLIQSDRACSYRVTEDMLCAIAPSGYSDVCTGDSGGPLVCPVGKQYVLAGAVSFGSLCKNKRRVSGVYADIYYLMSWIKSTAFSD